MRIEIDRDRCEGHAMCEAIAPAYFSVDDEGTLTVLQDEVPVGADAEVKSATLGCPVAALKLV
ncbi:ferredoxin [Nocardia aobensis]|uniref:Ferredoxin n=1 Tax=Nocardia aobensis TaxID=257277 RepID=A0ABW6PEJ4_9NOCA|nr:ferredoxin [Nocardia elegans]MBF6451103.1 ferredoxin [Nocardia elegans]